LRYGDDIEARSDREVVNDSAEAALDAVSGHGGSNAAADGVADAAVREIVSSRGEVNHRTAGSLAVAHYRLEVSTTAQTLYTREDG
jgi:hypothetical protein